MRRRPAAAAALSAVLATLLVSGCSPQQTEATPSPSASATSTTPPPAVETLVVAPGDKPPVVFDGDCLDALPAAVLTAATGLTDLVVTRRDQLWTGTIDNVGGLVCEWANDEVSGSVQIIPRHAVPDDVPLREQSHVGDCDWMCSWEYRTEELWVAGYASDLRERGREEADRIGAQIGAEITARLDPMTLDWRRDETGWWRAVDCSTTAIALSERLGQPVQGELLDYSDPPMPATRVGDAASHRVSCLFTADGQHFIASSEAGMAWSVPHGSDATPIDIGPPFTSAFRSGSAGYFGGTTVEISDGVNVLDVELIPGQPFSIQQIGEALAAVLAEAPA